MQGMMMHRDLRIADSLTFAAEAYPDQGLEPESVVGARRRAGRRLFGVEFKLVDDDGLRLPHDGEATAATVAAMDADGWFGTGDVTTTEPDGRLVIRDRTKDLVKSAGEWISSMELENAAVAPPEMAACATIALPMTAKGKVFKLTLRKELAGYVLPDFQ